MCMRFRSVFNNTENAAFPHLYPFFYITVVILFAEDVVFRVNDTYVTYSLHDCRPAFRCDGVRACVRTYRTIKDPEDNRHYDDGEPRAYKYTRTCDGE